jgi:hypothetical protein
MTSSAHLSFLYKYRGIGSDLELERLLSVLSKHEVWLSPPEAFNDPFDCTPSVQTTVTDEALTALATKVADARTRDEPEEAKKAMRAQLIKSALASATPFGAIQAEAKKIAAGVRDAARVFSLSARADDVLMWSHYGQSHTGVCLRFRMDVASIFQDARRVIYQQDRPVLDLIGDLGNAMEKALLHKAAFWSYEEEWRVIRLGAKPAQGFPAAALDGIIFGPRIAADKEASIRRAALKGGVAQNIFRAVPDDDVFRLNLVSDRLTGK